MRREVDMFTEIERREKRQKLKGESVCRIIEINVEVAGNDEFVELQQRRDKNQVTDEDEEWLGMSGRRWRTIDIED